MNAVWPLLRSPSCRARSLRSVCLPFSRMAATVKPADFDRSAFDIQKCVTALRVPKKQCAEAMKLMKGHTFNMPRMRCLVDDPHDSATKLLLLSTALEPGSIAGLPADLRAAVEEKGFPVESHAFTIGYTDLQTDEILRKVLPEGTDVPGSFETVGHIAHYNLREEHLPFKHIIGQVCIDKNPSIRTVVSKVGEIENEFRVFKMEVLAGEDSFVTEVSQHGHRYRLDYSAVFWNSRLEYEHKRLVETYFKPGEIVADIMAGIGPFAVPAAKAGCVVYSNDLNPESTKWCRVNIKLNKVTDRVRPFCMDGRDFVRLLCATPGGPADSFADLAAAPDAPDAPSPVPPGWRLPEGGVLWHHGVMNLPRTAVEFCDAFRGAFDPAAWRGRLPLIHCYTFQKKETRADVIKRVEERLGGPLDEPAIIHDVRNVAPDKYHICVTFRVPEAVAFASRDAAPDAKRQKTDCLE